MEAYEGSESGMIVFKPLQEPSLSSFQVHKRVGDGGCVCGTIHGSDNKVRVPQGQALYCCSGSSRTQRSPGRSAFAGQTGVSAL